MGFCAVFKCDTNSSKKLKKNKNVHKKIKLHRFPKDIKLAKIWVQKCGRINKINPTTSYICSKHFNSDQYLRNLRYELLNYFPKNRKTLKADAIPSEYLPTSGDAIVSENSCDDGHEYNQEAEISKMKGEMLAKSAKSSKYEPSYRSSFDSTYDSPTMYFRCHDVYFVSSEDEVDNFQKSTNVDAITPKLTDFIQISNNTSNCINLPSNSRPLVNGTSLQPSTISTVKPGMTQSIVFANQSNTMPSGGKISLVPTNFLLQQNTAQTSQIQIRPQPQPRIICTQANAQNSTGIVTSAGAGRMKVLLVNAFQNGKTPISMPTKDGSFTNSSLVTNANIQKINTPDTAVLKNFAELPNNSRTEEVAISKDPGVELLFNKLIVMQTENNEIQKQRLDIEKQRFEFEKSIAEKLLGALSSLIQIKEPDNALSSKRNEDMEQCNKETLNPPELIDKFNSFELLTPKIEKDD